MGRTVSSCTLRHGRSAPGLGYVIVGPRIARRVSVSTAANSAARYADRLVPIIEEQAMTSTTTGFAGFRPEAFAFFNELRDNNDPAWFKPRKAIYEVEVLVPFRELIIAVGAALQDVGLPLLGDPWRGIFRIYRDVRFSPDKRLYKTHAGAVLTRSGDKPAPGVLYLHLAPAESMVGAGFWHPEPDRLGKLRRAILADPDAFCGLALRLERASHPLSTDARLSRLPRGFEAAR